MRVYLRKSRASVCTYARSTCIYIQHTYTSWDMTNVHINKTSKWGRMDSDDSNGVPVYEAVTSHTCISHCASMNQGPPGSRVTVTLKQKKEESVKETNHKNTRHNIRATLEWSSPLQRKKGKFQENIKCRHDFSLRGNPRTMTSPQYKKDGGRWENK